MKKILIFSLLIWSYAAVYGQSITFTAETKGQIEEKLKHIFQTELPELMRKIRLHPNPYTKVSYIGMYNHEIQRIYELFPEEAFFELDFPDTTKAKYNYPRRETARAYYSALYPKYQSKVNLNVIHQNIKVKGIFQRDGNTLAIILFKRIFDGGNLMLKDTVKRVAYAEVLPQAGDDFRIQIQKVGFYNGAVASMLRKLGKDNQFVEKQLKVKGKYDSTKINIDYLYRFKLIQGINITAKIQEDEFPWHEITPPDSLALLKERANMTFDVQLFRNGSFQENIEKNIPANSKRGTYHWNIPVDLPSGRYRLRLVASDNSTVFSDFKFAHKNSNTTQPIIAPQLTLDEARTLVHDLQILPRDFEKSLYKWKHYSIRYIPQDITTLYEDLLYQRIQYADLKMYQNVQCAWGQNFDSVEPAKIFLTHEKKGIRRKIGQTNADSFTKNIHTETLKEGEWHLEIEAKPTDSDTVVVLKTPSFTVLPYELTKEEKRFLKDNIRDAPIASTSSHAQPHISELRTDRELYKPKSNSKPDTLFVTDIHNYLTAPELKYRTKAQLYGNKLIGSERIYLYRLGNENRFFWAIPKSITHNGKTVLKGEYYIRVFTGKKMINTNPFYIRRNGDGINFKSLQKGKSGQL